MTLLFDRGLPRAVSDVAQLTGSVRVDRAVLVGVNRQPDSVGREVKVRPRFSLMIASELPMACADVQLDGGTRAHVPIPHHCRLILVLPGELLVA